MDELLGAFVADCRRSLTALESELCRLAQQPNDTNLLACVFRGVHTIKGTCGFLDLSRLHDIAHAIEDVLGKLRCGELGADGPLITLMLEALDGIAAILDGLDRTGLEPAGDDRPLIAALEALAAGGVDELGSTRDPSPRAWRQSDALAPASCLNRSDEIMSGLQAGVEETRVERMGAAWRPLPRLVRHLAIELDKPMALEMRGTEIEIDGCLIEPIKASLLHLVRNAADHGLEGPAERRRRGKREEGRIAVAVCRQADHVVIEVSDDGRGLDTEQIRKAAVTSQHVGPADAATMTAGDCQRLIFRPGFSTAQTVTPVSGRGVGLDAVRAGIEQVGGTIEVCSVPGRGAVFALQVPCTPAKAAAGTVGVEDERRVSFGSNAVDAGSKGQRTAKRTDASRRKHTCRPAATARPDRKSVVPAPRF